MCIGDSRTRGRIHGLRLCAASLVLGACGGEESESPAEGLLAEVSRAANALVAGRIGGTVAAANDVTVEVLPHRNGDIEAVLVDANGSLVSDAQQVEVEVMGEDGQPQTVTLTWDRATNRYLGKAPGKLAADTSATVRFSKQNTPHTAQIARVHTAPSAASHGGTIVVAADHSAEVAPQPDGSVHAWIEGPEGDVEGQLDGDVRVWVQGADGAAHTVSLEWNAELGAHVGRPATQVTWAPGPLAIEVDAGGRVSRSRVERVVVAGAPAHGGDVVVVGDYRVEVVPQEDGRILAYAVDVEGNPVERRTTLHVQLGADRVEHRLRWDGDVGAYVVRVDPTIDVSVAPIGVVVSHQGRRHRGGISVRHGHVRGWHHRRAEARVRLPGAQVRVDEHPGLMLGHGMHGGLRIEGPAVRVRGPGHSIMVNTGGHSVMVRAGRPGGSVRVRAGSRGHSVMARSRGGMGMGMASVMIRF